MKRKIFQVTVQCVMTEMADIDVIASSQKQAERITKLNLERRGWSGVMGDRDGALVECESSVIPMGQVAG